MLDPRKLAAHGYLDGPRSTAVSMTSSAEAAIGASQGEDVLERVICIAPAPLLAGEAGTDYKAVAERMVAVIQPKETIEEFLTRDVIDLNWDILRLRRLKAELLRVSAASGVTSVLNRLGYDEREGHGSASTLGPMWASGDEARGRKSRPRSTRRNCRTRT